MNNAIFTCQRPENDRSRNYAPGCEERWLLEEALEQVASESADIPLIIGGEEVRTGNTGTVVMPHKHGHILATYHKMGEAEILFGGTGDKSEGYFIQPMIIKAANPRPTR